MVWSSDGKYLAANVHDTTGNAAPDQMVMTWVWNTATKQIVLQHTSVNSNDSLAWSLTSDVLAFNSQENTIVLTLWDAATNQLTSFQANVDGPLAWSPDGRYIAFAGTTTNEAVDPTVSPISIIDATSGKLVYEYKQMDKQITTLAWSPDGHYIASGTSDFAKIWSAE